MKTYIIDRLDIISLYFNLLNECIYIHNFYNLVIAKKVYISIPILKYKLATHLDKKDIILKNFTVYHET